MKPATKRWIIHITDTVTGYGLKIGITVFVLCSIYLIVLANGDNVRNLSKLSAKDQADLAQIVSYALLFLKVSGVSIVLSTAIRLFAIESVGTIMSVIGALIYFVAPELLIWLASRTGYAINPVSIAIIFSYRKIGGVCLLVGLIYVVRDGILRLWKGISIRRVLEAKWGDEAERLRKLQKKKIYCNCWDMAFCREYVRNVCPAAKKKKPCWRLKSGCYCDEKVIMMAMLDRADPKYTKSLLHSLGLDQSPNTLQSGRAKRARCRRCSIYAEHQRQKYGVLSPVVFVAVGVLIFQFYNQVASWSWKVISQTDRILSFLSPIQKQAFSINNDAQTLTVIAIVWLAIMAVSMGLRTLEYLIFDLQV